MAFACIPASTAKPRVCQRCGRHREQLRRGLLNTDPGSAALKPAAMARPQVGSTPEVATAAAGSASRLLYKYKRLLTALGPQRVMGGGPAHRAHASVSRPSASTTAGPLSANALNRSAIVR